jgi:hypothetical protein
MKKRNVSYKIEHASEPPRGSFGHYRYYIYNEGRLIAHFWHDYRGDDHGIEFIDGTEADWPVGRMIDFIEGGGPEPLRLSERAVAYLEKKRRHWKQAGA